MYIKLSETFQFYLLAWVDSRVYKTNSPTYCEEWKLRKCVCALCTVFCKILSNQWKSGEMFTKKSHADVKKSTLKIQDSKKDSASRLRHLRTVLGTCRQFYTFIQIVISTYNIWRNVLLCTHLSVCDSVCTLVDISVQNKNKVVKATEMWAEFYGLVKYCPNQNMIIWIFWDEIIDRSSKVYLADFVVGCFLFEFIKYIRQKYLV